MKHTLLLYGLIIALVSGFFSLHPSVQAALSVNSGWVPSQQLPAHKPIEKFMPAVKETWKNQRNLPLPLETPQWLMRTFKNSVQRITPADSTPGDWGARFAVLPVFSHTVKLPSQP